MGKYLDFWLPKSYKNARDEKLAAEAEQKKPRRRQKRRYEAARPSRVAGGFKGYPSPSMNELLRGDLRGLIVHCRQQAENNDYVKAYFDLLDRNVLGPAGIQMVPNAKEGRGDGARPDKGANTILADEWQLWGRFGSPTVCGQHSWRSAETMIVRSTARDGGILLRQYRGRTQGDWGYKFQMLEIDHLDMEKSQILNNGGRIIMGVEVNRFDKVVAYHLFTEHPGEHMGGRSRETQRVPSEDIIHIFRQERAGSVLGIPWAYTSLRRLNMIAGYEEAALHAARAGASKMGFFVQDGADEIDPDDLDDLEETAEIEDGKLIEHLDPGTIETLPEGVKFDGFDPTYPHSDFSPFMKAMLRGAAAGLDVAYSSLANDLEGANFSSLRAGLGEEREGYRNRQRFFWERAHNPIFREWLPMAMAMGRVNLPIAKFEKFANPRWRGRGWQAVNPQQETNAHDTELANGTRSPQSIVAERGETLDEVYDEIAEARRMADERGLSFSASDKDVEPEPNQL